MHAIKSFPAINLNFTQPAMHDIDIQIDIQI